MTVSLDFEIGGTSTTPSVAILGFEVAGLRTPRKNPFSVGRGFRPEATFWIDDKFVWTAGPLRETPEVLKNALERHALQLDAWLDQAIIDEATVVGARLTLDLPQELVEAVLATTVPS
jgi:hypothetical protein